MVKFPKKLSDKLQEREHLNNFRSLKISSSLVDFSSNDYLGFSREKWIANRAKEILNSGDFKNGATGSRLLSGNHPLYPTLEDKLSKTYGFQSALVFNSGYDANLGFFSCVPQRTDIIFYDELVHASIRDGIKMGNAKAYKFKHNDLSDLKAKLELIVHATAQTLDTNIYVVTESVFSMDGDSPNLEQLVAFCEENKVYLIIDEAHAVGVFGKGLVAKYNLQGKVFAQIITFGKALGCHGAAILGSEQLKDFLINFARSLIYTTALSPHSIAVIHAAHEFFGSENGQEKTVKLHENIVYFKSILKEVELDNVFLPSDSAIQIALISGNHQTRKIGSVFVNNGYDIRPILSPTVPKGNERLRICLHSFNTKEEIKKMLLLLKDNG